MKLLVASSIDLDALDTLCERHHVRCAFGAKREWLEPLIEDREILIFRSGVDISARLMERAPNLQLLVRAGSGLDNLDVDYVRRRGLSLVRIPQPGARAVAELTFAFMLSLSRQLMIADRLLRQGRWAKNELTGHSLEGKVLGILGAGNIGSLVGEMGAEWNMEVIGCCATSSPARAAELDRKGIRLTNFEEVTARADYLSIHVPLNDATQNLIDARTLARMKPGSYLLNSSRGGVVDEPALYRALVEGKLRGAALDVHAKEGEGNVSPLAELPNVLLTPHIGAMTVDSQREIGRRVIQSLNDFMLQKAGTALAKAC